MTTGLPRSRQELAAARVLIDQGFPAQAVSRSYYAALYAAEAALLILGETRSKHSGVISAFHRLVVHDGGLEPVIGRLLAALFSSRGQADYSTLPVPDHEAPAALADATRVVDAVEAWLGSRTTG
ncbi:MAG: HEPN domain-containing protein [Pseudonocardia sp.]